MKATYAAVMLLGMLSIGTASAQPPLAEVAQNLKERCQQELTTHCNAVTPGEGRVFACLYAHSDKLSGRCEYGLYEAAQELEYAISKVGYIADACADDLQKHCADIKPGQGRIAACLKKNQNKAAPACRQAIKDTGMLVK